MPKGSGTTPPPRPSNTGKRYLVRLHNIGAVRRELAQLYREARRGDVSTGDASKLGHILFLIARILEGADLEKRIERLERALAEHGQGTRET